MIPWLQKLLGREAKEEDAGEAASPRCSTKMTLEERKAWRREMMFQSVREHLLALEVLGSAYRVLVMNVDERNHRFIVMLHVTGLFDPKKAGANLSFEEVEQDLRRRTYARYGIVLDGIYWRVDSTLAIMPEHMKREADQHAGAPGTSRRRREIVGDVHFARERMARQAFEPVTDSERKAFEEAIRIGAAPPAIHIGDKTYVTEMAPLNSTAA